MSQGTVIAVEGNIGSGKTTACNLLRDRIYARNESVKLFEEEVNLDLLTLFLSDMKKYGFAFQLYMLRTRLSSLEQAKKFAANGGIAILDRSIIGDWAFGNLHFQFGNIDEAEWKVYQSLYESNVKLLPDKVIYLDCKPETSLERIIRRDRSGEKKDYTIEYLKSLEACYEKSLRNTHLIPIIRVDWSHDRDEKKIAEDILQVCNLDRLFRAYPVTILNPYKQEILESR